MRAMGIDGIRQVVAGSTMTAIVAEVILGYLTFTGSLMAAGKLQEIKWIPQRPVTYPLQNVSNIALLVVAILCGLALIYDPKQAQLLFPLIIILAFAIILANPSTSPASPPISRAAGRPCRSWRPGIRPRRSRPTRGAAEASRSAR